VGVVLLAAGSLVWTRHSQRLPGWSQHVGPALCHAGFRLTGLDGYGDGRPGHGYLVQAAEQEIRRRVMSSGAALMSMFRPMLEIGAHVLFAIASGLLALVALRISARAICQGEAGVFLVG
jgi:hypothetical protein